MKTQTHETPRTQALRSALSCAAGLAVLSFATSAFALHNTVTLVSGTLAGQAVRSDTPQITVSPGAPIQGAFTVKVHNVMEAAAVAPLAATPTWGTPSSSFWEINPWVPVGNSTHEVAVNLTAPTNYGIYYLAVAMSGTYNSAQIMSGTHPAYPADWANGNKVALLPASHFELAAVKGWIPFAWQTPSGPADGMRDIAMTAIRIVVARPATTTTNTVRLLSGTLAGQSLTASNRQIIVKPGTPIQGSFSVEVHNVMGPNAVAPLAATPTWGNPSSSYWQIDPWVGTGTTTHDVTVDLNAPANVGVYYIAVAMSGTYNSAQIMSGTHPAYPADWVNGNKVALLPPGCFEAASIQGWTPFAWHTPTGPASGMTELPLTAVRVVVEEDVCTRMAAAPEFGVVTNQKSVFGYGFDFDGRFLVWVDTRNGLYDIYAYDLATQTERRISDIAADQGACRVSGGVVAWLVNPGQIYLKDLTGRLPGITNPVVSGPGVAGPDIEGDWIVWAQDTNSDGMYDLYARNLRTGEQFPIPGPGNKWSFSIYGDLVIYTSASCVDVWACDRDIYGFNLQTRTNFPIKVGPGSFTAVDLSGDLLLFNETAYSGHGNVYVLNLKTMEETLVATNGAGLAISGRTVVYRDWPSEHGFIYDLVTGQTCEFTTTRTWPAVMDDEFIFWKDRRPTGGGELDNFLYGKRMPSAPFVTLQPRSQVGFWGKTNTLSVTVVGTEPLSYQWRKDGVAIEGATNATLVLGDLKTNDGGNYTVVVSNGAGSVTSDAAVLTVKPADISIAMYAGVTIDGLAGRTYRIEYVTDLRSTNWTTLTNLTLTDQVQVWLDMDSGGKPKRFYRVMIP